jgi:hypothetical protein
VHALGLTKKKFGFQKALFRKTFFVVHALGHLLFTLTFFFKKNVIDAARPVARASARPHQQTGPPANGAPGGQHQVHIKKIKNHNGAPGVRYTFF